MDKQKSIETLQFFVTHLAEGAIVHKQQGMIFKAQGLTKLGEKYIGHFSEEMGWVEKFTERILDLGGEIKFEGMKSRDLICDPVEYVKADLAIQEPGVELLMKCMEGVKDDPTTYDLLKAYLKDEEEDRYRGVGLWLIEKPPLQSGRFGGGLYSCSNSQFCVPIFSMSSTAP